jgi:hypothetical protein
VSDTTLSLPPLLDAHPVPPGADPSALACDGAAEDRLGAGDFLFAERAGLISAALVLEPEIGRDRCGEMLFVAMVAFGDALGALAPPEVAVTHSWPAALRVYGAVAGRFDLHLAPGENPAWMVLGIEVALLPQSDARTEPGEIPDRTDLWNEGCGEIAPQDLLESFARHLVAGIHGWEQDGFRGVHGHWWARLDAKAPMALPGLGTPTGLDASGNALWRDAAGAMQLTSTLDALKTLREQTP